ncbi:LOW QUALITY PROTEIN: deoxyribose-phosphate aldolase [Limimaricola cinnabarinus LL-001]|uniref:Deoxyribose-phosphate aldolase n=1 Tax=Limimaricola cinnabarinus LL-001 TaxID=1337093 RepID=U3AA51_9RHOB|nr:LOW QUALITY PROTEIN: deoxyribose-phosphate aldolase [Limimaricola cinnabarinus LL-001]
MTTAALPDQPESLPNHARNLGTPLDAVMFEGHAVNRSAAERRAASLTTRRSVKKTHQAAWLVNAIRCIDLTTLAGDDTEGRVQRLCAKRVSRSRRASWTGSVSPKWAPPARSASIPPVPHAVKALRGTGIPVASVATGFPAGLMPLHLRLEEIRWTVDQGAHEIDIVITREHVLKADWPALYDEVAAMREACGDAHLKAILATGDIATLRNVYSASMVAMQAGADFIKTSTGKEGVNATLPVSLTMVRALRDYGDATGHRVGFKPAGGMKSTKDALAWQYLMKEELGNDWLQPDLFRLGASSMLGDIERQLEHHVTGRYAAAHRHSLA